METAALKERLDQLLDLLVKFSMARPDNFNVERMQEEASHFWDDLV